MSWYFFLPLIIITGSLGVIIVILIRKFPQLVHLDITALPAEKEARRKKELIDQRIKEQSRHLQIVWLERLRPLLQLWKNMQLRFRQYVGRIQKLWYHEQVSQVVQGDAPLEEDKEVKFTALVQNAEQYLGSGQFDKAEEFFIAAIKINQSSAVAYRGLADTYLAQGSIEEAEQTYRFLLHLNPTDDNIMVKLGDIAESQGKFEEAIEYYQQAVIANDSLSPRFYHLGELFLKIKQPQIAKEALVAALELEPKNPKYLDLLAEIAILCRDKSLALKMYNDLHLVNPHNQKLENLRARIYQLK